VWTVFCILSCFLATIITIGEAFTVEFAMVDYMLRGRSPLRVVLHWVLFGAAYVVGVIAFVSLLALI